jgi:hypothetical protein
MADGLVIFTFAITARNSHNVLNLHRAISTKSWHSRYRIVNGDEPHLRLLDCEKTIFFFDPGKVRVITRISVSGRLIP